MGIFSGPGQGVRACAGQVLTLRSRCGRASARRISSGWSLAALGVVVALPSAVLAQDRAAVPVNPPAGQAVVRPDAPPEAKKPDVFVKDVVPQGEPADEGTPYPVSAFVMEYGTKEPAERPDLGDPAFQNLVVKLSQVDGVYAAPGSGRPSATLKLSDVTAAAPVKMTRSGIVQVCRAVSAEFNRRGIFAIFVAPSAEDIDERELRESGHPTDKRKGTALRVVVWTGVVRDIRTISGGERDLDAPKMNNPAHALTLRNSPIRKGDLLRKDKLDDYTFALNRHPGRRVDVAVGAADDEGGVQLDYLVTENNPWTAYFHIANTGTKNTDKWRERFGFVHNQLTNNDDIFRLDYATAGFDSSHAVSPSYEFPIMTNVLRAKAYGTWSEFTASDVGAFGDQFRGRSWTLGAELDWTVLQISDTFVDAVGGLRFENVKIEGQKSGAGVVTTGEETFWLPYLGGKIERDTDAMHSFAQVTYEFTANDGNRGEVDKLGRKGADTGWGTLHWDAEQSLYLEPLFSPQNPANMTLAHELAASFRGQYGFGNKLIPSAQGVAGGMYSVRGYPESVVAGDTILLAGIEYRFHLPPVLGMGSPGTLLGREFRYVPQGPYSRADWDLMFKAFLDYGHTQISDRQPTEVDEDLASVGLGIEFQMWRNVNLRVDWGYPIMDVNQPVNGIKSGGQPVDSGDSRFHLSATLSF